MEMSRRDLAVAGTCALVASGLLLGRVPGADAAADEAAVAENVEILRKSMFDKDQAKLAQVCANQLSYGHSDGRVETKDEFITAVMGRKAALKSLAYPELKVAVVGDAAVARHLHVSESELDGKTTTTRIGVLQVWQKQNGGWRLLARQAFRLPAPA